MTTGAGGRRGHLLVLVGLVALLMTAAVPAGAQDPDFSPSAEYHLCTEASQAECTPEYSTGSVAQFRVELAQDRGEEEFKNITLEFAPGFRFAKDEEIENGERLGEAHIATDAGPGCVTGVGTVPLELDGYLEERDRTEEEIDDGVRVVLRLNLDPIPPLDIRVYGNEREGHRAVTDIEDRAATCPTFSFKANFYGRSAGSNVPLLMTPTKPGRYDLRAIFTGTEDSVVEYRYLYKFTR